MSKMKLQLNALRVQSFETDAAAERRPGTVKGHADLATGSGCMVSDNDHCPSIGCTFFRPCDTIAPCGESVDCPPSEFYIC